jgi:RNA polymerase sigma-70 factor (ECF subfamily)
LSSLPAKISDEEIVALLMGRDKRGVSSLYQAHSRLIFGVIYRIVKMEDVAENVMQDVFLRVWQNIESYNPSKGRFLTWVVNIARNASIDVIRSKDYRKNQQTEEIEPNAAHHRSDEIDVDNIGVKEIIEKLPPKYSTLINLIYFEGYTQQEVAEKFDMPLGTVKSRIRKAFSELRSVLG